MTDPDRLGLVILLAVILALVAGIVGLLLARTDPRPASTVQIGTAQVCERGHECTEAGS